MKKFKKFYIEITNKCNLACDFCPKTKRKAQLMDYESFCKILDEIRPYTDYIYLHVKGEPLSHPELERFLDVSYEKGFMVNITTNGTLIKNVEDKIITKKALRQINFSLHSFDGNNQKGDKGDYINNILDFTAKANQDTDMIISFRLWNLDEDNITNLQKKKNREILEAIEKQFGLPYKIQEEIIQGRGIKLKDRIYLNQDYRFQWPDIDIEEISSKGFCYGLRNQIGILVDGTVIPCCLDGEGIVNLGNIKEKAFSEIIESQRVKMIIEGFSSGIATEELCKRCGYRKRFSSN
ncbi:SPASM domain-containing protein [Clostridium cellulovorans]|uniref:Radical SAM domain protein n=1 Tax=Clostridium cellulovorans (strain ATCC 35296 / DSM 3052 / OCM 3 / 743B) TaxID=573061 RepID=D9SQ50_CLOC7|nr:SPASM domain-containing protein [Clostridium cellulovorans]ADL52186.1 Radical SAM domain protein [Clostridium cellulovorans 743B]